MEDDIVVIVQIAQILLFPIIGYIFWLIYRNANHISKLERRLNDWQLHTVKSHPTKIDLKTMSDDLKSELKGMRGEISSMYAEVRNVFIEIQRHNLVGRKFQYKHPMGGHDEKDS